MGVSLSEKNVKTRKPHPCVWCPEPILVGEVATRYAGIYEGEFSSWYMHPECLAAFREDLRASGEYESEIEEYAHKRGSTKWRYEE